ncbi:DUF599 domain-containing protein [Roseomonas sp. E05]|uniref:DUF599 domain-containing protein n=1 Tax=Roseomonas sp. E05 TaxID=3046310 RepID=UPI0024B99DEE|nr:DUF599 domain-containing protein [Roseomonas sp. E05]MDJ0389875.1 DUF599 domain-containing protein [Roseomonas sp. E05]
MDLPLSTLDWIALAIFVACWSGYAMVVDRVPSIRARSVIAAMDEHRRRWMRMVPERENRIADISIIGNLMTSTSFLANTSIFILGGLMAMLGAPDLGRRIFGAVPFLHVPIDEAGWEIRIFLLIFIFVRAFFELTWALRQFNYCSICVGALGRLPEALPQTEVAAEVANRAARHFNTGLRAYYFGLAALAWILHPVALILSSLLVLRELHRREFRSVVRDALKLTQEGP